MSEVLNKTESTLEEIAQRIDQDRRWKDPHPKDGRIGYIGSIAFTLTNEAW